MFVETFLQILLKLDTLNIRLVKMHMHPARDNKNCVSMEQLALAATAAHDGEGPLQLKRVLGTCNLTTLASPRYMLLVLGCF